MESIGGAGGHSLIPGVIFWPVFVVIALFSVGSYVVRRQRRK